MSESSSLIDAPNTVQIPAELFNLLERRATETGFASVEEYVVFVLTEVARDEEVESQESELSAEDEDKLLERLRGLGYIE